MASYEIKTQRTQIHTPSPYGNEYQHLTFLTEYSVSPSSDMGILNKESDILKERKFLRIEDEIQSLYRERHLQFKTDNMETNLERTKMNKTITCSNRNENKELEENVYINEESDLLRERKYRRIEDEIPSERHLNFNQDKDETNLEKTNSNLRKLTTPKKDKTDRKENKRAEKEGYINHMPDEILLMLLKYLRGMDRVNVGSTCKRFRHLLINSGLLWKSRCISWGPDSHRYAALAPQIGKLVIVLYAQRNMDNFCLDLFNRKGSHTNIIHIIDPEIVDNSRRLVCWLKNEKLYQTYEIYLDRKRINLLEFLSKIFIWTGGRNISYEFEDFL